MLSHEQFNSAVVHPGELMIPDNFIHTWCKVEIMLEKI